MNTSFGETLSNAREAKGLTTSQIASKTRMLVQIVEEMENEDFHRIAAPIYGRGFVRLYAECVDLDPIPLVKEFMDIYEGRRAPIVRTREVPVHEQPPVTPPEPPPVVTPRLEPTPEAEPNQEPMPVVTPQPEQTPEPPPVAPLQPEQSPEPPPVAPLQPEQTPEPPPVAPLRLERQVTAMPETIPEPVHEPPPVVRGLELFEAPAAHLPQETNDVTPSSPNPGNQPPPTNVADIFSGSPYLSTESSYGAEGPSADDRFRKSLSNVSHGVIQTVREIPRSVWRISLLSITALVLLAILAWGCIKLYNATSITPIQQPQAIDATREANVSKDIKDAKDAKDPKSAKGLGDLKKPKGTKPTAKPQPTPAKRQLRTTGQKVPTLYAD